MTLQGWWGDKTGVLVVTAGVVGDTARVSKLTAGSKGDFSYMVIARRDFKQAHLDSRYTLAKEMCNPNTTNAIPPNAIKCHLNFPQNILIKCFWF